MPRVKTTITTFKENKRISEEKIKEDRGSRESLIIIRIILNNSRKIDFLLLLTKVYKMTEEIIFRKTEYMHHH